MLDSHVGQVVVLRNCQTQLSINGNIAQELKIQDVAIVEADMICLKNCNRRL